MNKEESLGDHMKRIFPFMRDETPKRESMERELYEGLKNAVDYEERAYKSRLKYADWYNNYTPEVGQGNYQYESASAMPMWVEPAKQLIKKYEDSQR